MPIPTELFTPAKLGSVELANRVVMAPLTRTRATPYPEFQPGALMAEHYGSRASNGLIIAEATAVTDYSAFYGEPGLFTAKQAEGWKLTTDAVHANGGKIFVLECWDQAIYLEGGGAVMSDSGPTP